MTDTILVGQGFLLKQIKNQNEIKGVKIAI